MAIPPSAEVEDAHFVPMVVIEFDCPRTSGARHEQWDQGSLPQRALASVGTCALCSRRGHQSGSQVRFAQACCAAQSVGRASRWRALLRSPQGSGRKTTRAVAVCRPAREGNGCCSFGAVCAVSPQSCSLALGLLAKKLRPNPSVNATSTSYAPGPRGTQAYHVPRGPGAPLAAARYLKR